MRVSRNGAVLGLVTADALLIGGLVWCLVEPDIGRTHNVSQSSYIAPVITDSRPEFTVEAQSIGGGTHYIVNNYSATIVNDSESGVIDTGTSTYRIKANNREELDERLRTDHEIASYKIISPN